jgi:hypothetical protein
MDVRTWRRRVLAVLVVFVGVGAGGTSANAEDRAAEGRPSLVAATLDQAVGAGWLVASGRNTDGDLRMELVLTSRSNEPVVVDVSGRHMTPRSGRRVQRLGLSHPVDVTPLGGYAPGVFAVRLAPGETRRLRMRCCCMDEDLPAPKPGDGYGLASQPPPPAVEAALRWWVEHPKALRQFVNEAVWRMDPSLLDRAEVAPEPPPPVPTVPVVRSVGGTLYVLTAGRLARLDALGSRHEMADGVLQVFPTPLGVHGVLGGSDGPDLARLALDGAARPSTCFGVGDEPLLDFWSVPRGPFLWRTRSGVFLRGSLDAEPTALFPADRSIRISLAPTDLLGGRFVLVDRPVREPKSSGFAVHDVNARAGTVVHRKTFWNLRDMAVGPAGVFAVSADRTLLRLRGDRLFPLIAHESAGEKIERIVAVGRARLVVGLVDGVLAARDLDSELLVRIGGDLEANPPTAHEPWNLSLDPVTDDVVWVAQGSLWRLRPGYGAPDSVDGARPR